MLKKRSIRLQVITVESEDTYSKVLWFLSKDFFKRSLGSQPLTLRDSKEGLVHGQLKTEVCLFSLRSMLLDHRLNFLKHLLSSDKITQLQVQSSKTRLEVDVSRLLSRQITGMFGRSRVVLELDQVVEHHQVQLASNILPLLDAHQVITDLANGLKLLE